MASLLDAHNRQIDYLRLSVTDRCVTSFGRSAAPFIVAAASTIVLAVGFSRVYLGVHYFSDVVGGYLSGIAWLAVCVSAVEIARRHARTNGMET